MGQSVALKRTPLYAAHVSMGARMVDFGGWEMPVQYTGLVYEHGGFVDDILVHKVTEQHYFLCVNAANQEKDFEHIRTANNFDAEVDFASDRYAQIAVQGPLARRTLQKLTPVDLSSIGY